MQILSWPRRFLILLLRFYKRVVSPLLPPACRFHPTCSEYCREAVEEHGALRGAWLGLLRLLRCNPLFRGGFDPVPAKGGGDAKRAEKSREEMDETGKEENECSAREDLEDQHRAELRVSQIGVREKRSRDEACTAGS